MKKPTFADTLLRSTGKLIQLVSVAISIGHLRPFSSWNMKKKVNVGEKCVLGS